MIRWLAVLALSACAATGVREYGPQPQLVSRGALTEARVRVIWVNSEIELLMVCGPSRDGCALGHGECVIWAYRPKDFNDEPTLAVLGHELWHCLGATHESN
jgi:hypothetical protein